MTAITGVVISKTDVVSGQKFYTANYAKLIDDINGFIADVIAKAVDLASAQTIAGAKTFTGDTVVPDQSASNNSTKAANTKYVDTALAAKESNIVTQATANLFGSRTTNDTTPATLVKDTVYKAQCDGYLDATIGATYSIRGYTDGSNPPTTIVQVNASGAGQWGSSVSVKVNKDDYVKITVSGGTPTIYWLPYGTGGLVAQ